MSDTAINVSGLKKKYGSFWAVNDVTFSIPKGSAFGFLGPNGAGKTTTINMLMGLLPPTAGSMSVLGLNPTRNAVDMRQNVGFVPEIDGFYEWMTIDDHINLVSPYYEKWQESRCVELKEEFRLNGDQKIKALSKGMRAKFSLLLALAHDPDLLVLDEPTGGLDPAARRNFIESILGHYQQSGKTILVSSHLMNEFSGLLDYVGFIKEGRVELTERLDVLREKTKRIRLIFDEGVPENLEIEYSLSTYTNGREAIITCKDFDPESTPKQMEKYGANKIDIEDMNLEDIFVELVKS